MVREATRLAMWLGAGLVGGRCAERLLSETSNFPFFSVTLALFVMAGVLQLRRARLRSFLSVISHYADRQLEHEIPAAVSSSPAGQVHD